MSVVGVQNPPVPGLSPADEMLVRHALRRNRALATGHSPECLYMRLAVDQC